MENDLISIDEAVERYGYGRRTLFDWLAAGKLTPFKIRKNRRTFLDRKELLAVVSQARKPSKKV